MYSRVAVAASHLCLHLVQRARAQRWKVCSVRVLWRLYMRFFLWKGPFGGISFDNDVLLDFLHIKHFYRLLDFYSVAIFRYFG